jgi:hypothetical protein
MVDARTYSYTKEEYYEHSKILRECQKKERNPDDKSVKCQVVPGMAGFGIVSNQVLKRDGNKQPNEGHRADI